MGDIKRKRKKFRKPRKLYDKTRIEEENELLMKYGLKNKRSVWKAEAKISKVRRRAKQLISKPEEEKQEFFNKLNKIGLNVKSIADVLALTKEDLLNRRLQTFLLKKGLVKTVRQARQLIIHKQVLVNGKTVNIPSFVVTTDLEKKIELKKRKEKKKASKVEVKEEKDE